MALYGFAAFSGAFLLFLLQPLIGKFILPWFGGTPAVWTTCLVVFQVMLLAGYCYAFLSSRWLKPRWQVMLHGFLVCGAIAMLPITPDMSWKAALPDHPQLRICKMLIISVGLPFLVLAATAPLLQHWFTLTCRGESPFKLYAFSNAGSLLALLSYPAVFEIWFTRTMQAIIWSAGLGVYGLVCAVAGVRVWRTAAAAAAGSPPVREPANGDKSLFHFRRLWLLLPFCSSLLLLAITNRICQDLAPTPLLWVLPLSLYLTTFILCFNYPAWYARRWFGPAAIASLTVMGLVLGGVLAVSTQVEVCIFFVGLFLCCAVAHAELYLVRPPPARLTAFYLAISAGGALGGVFAAVVAPFIFSDYFELHFGLLLCAGLFLLVWRDTTTERVRRGWLRLALIGSATLMLVPAMISIHGASARPSDTVRVYHSRNFYGVLNVYRHETRNKSPKLMELVHGRIAHGMQFLEPNLSRTPTLYYSANSGVGRAFASLPAGNRHVGVVGLGAGTLAAYMKSGERIRFYEINPEVETIAKTCFTFLANCPAQVEVVLGDARLSLEREKSQQFDLLALDAFNSDSIPIHLLTREAFALYERHLKTNGVIAVNISNMSLNLKPVVFTLAREFGYGAAVMRQPSNDETRGIISSTWVLLSHESTIASPLPLAFEKGPLWTDDFNSLFGVLRWRRSPDAPTTDINGLKMAGNRANRLKLAANIQKFREAVAQDSNSSVALNNLACLLATAPDPTLRDGHQAVRLAERACELTHYRNSSALSTLAAAYAEAGQFEQAVATAEKACALATQNGEKGILAGNRQMLDSFRHNQAYHQAWQ